MNGYAYGNELVIWYDHGTSNVVDSKYTDSNGDVCTCNCTVNNSYDIVVGDGCTGGEFDDVTFVNCSSSNNFCVGMPRCNKPRERFFYELNQNYPNPFNPTTKISYSISTPNYVKIVVYDLLGREVATVVNTFQTAGEYTIDFNATNLSSGIYIYKMESGNFQDIKRMLVIK